MPNRDSDLELNRIFPIQPKVVELPRALVQRYENIKGAIFNANGARRLQSEYVPFRLLVQIALTNAFQQITPANDFTYDMSEKVYRGRNVFGQQTKPPYIAILERNLQPDHFITPIKDAKGYTDYQLIIQGFLPDDKDCPTDIGHVLMGDVKMRLAMLKFDETNPDKLFRFGNRGNHAEKITWDGGVVRPPEELNPCVCFYLRVSLKLIEDDMIPFGAGPLPN